MFIINIIDDIIVIIIITINHIMFQDLYHFGFCTKYNNNESENSSNTKMYPDSVLMYSDYQNYYCIWIIVIEMYVNVLNI